jgi:hypothetical protein
MGLLKEERKKKSFISTSLAVSPAKQSKNEASGENTARKTTKKVES